MMRNRALRIQRVPTRGVRSALLTEGMSGANHALRQYPRPRVFPNRVAGLLHHAVSAPDFCREEDKTATRPRFRWLHRFEVGVASRAAWKGVIKLSLITIPIRVYPATDTGSDVSFRQLHRKCHTPIQLKKWCPHCEEEVSADDTVKGYESAKGRYIPVSKEEIASVRLVAVLPREKGLILYTLRTAGEVRDMSDLDGLAFAEVKTKPDEVKLARQVLNALDSETNLSAFTDHYEEALVRATSGQRAARVIAHPASARKTRRAS